MIITDNISKQFGSDYLFEGINISFSSGEKYGLIGANGSGKSTFMKILTLVSGIFVMFISSKYIQINKMFKIEYPILILSAILGMMVMISSNDLIVFYIGLELQSLALYVLASFNRDNLLSSESGVKYFILSALSSGILLYGCSLLYGFSNSTNFVLIAENISSISYVGTRCLRRLSNICHILLFNLTKNCRFNSIYKIFVCSFYKYV